ncbi:MAG: hypothetical protein ACXVCM_14515 [Ktedonobacteraceae bacterium]
MKHRLPPNVALYRERRCYRAVTLVLSRLTWSRFWRLSLASMMALLYVLGIWSGLLAQAQLAFASSHQTLTSLAPHRETYASNISACPSLTGTLKVVGTVDGLGPPNTYSHCLS